MCIRDSVNTSPKLEITKSCWPSFLGRSSRTKFGSTRYRDRSNQKGFLSPYPNLMIGLVSFAPRFSIGNINGILVSRQKNTIFTIRPHSYDHDCLRRTVTFLLAGTLRKFSLGATSFDLPKYDAYCVYHCSSFCCVLSSSCNVYPWLMYLPINSQNQEIYTTITLLKPCC